MKKEPKRTRVTKGSGNVFADIGLDNAWEHQLKADLAIEIILAIQKCDLTQAKAGHLIGATQPDISNLKNGQLKGFTLDRLFGFLRRLDIDVEVSLKARKPGARRRRMSDRHNIYAGH
jgi:predicted XRE-type DNA-binding protein